MGAEAFTIRRLGSIRICKGCAQKVIHGSAVGTIFLYKLSGLSINIHTLDCLLYFASSMPRHQQVHNP